MDEINQKTIIFSPRYSRDSRVLRKSADNLGWITIRLSFGFNPDELDIGGKVVVYCESYFAEILAEQFGFSLIKPMDDLLPRLNKEFTKRTIEFVLFSDFEMPEDRKFIKSADFKFFPARIFEPDECLPDKTGMEPEDPILISEIVDFVDEFRLFILDGVIMTGSVYVRNRALVEDFHCLEELESDVIEFCEKLLIAHSQLIPRSVVIDIGRMKDGNLAVIEFNPSWTSGIYASSPQKVLKCIENAVVYK